MLWRASISKNPAFEQVNLGPHEEKIRPYDIYENSGKSSHYGCVDMTMIDTELLHNFFIADQGNSNRPFEHKRINS